MIVFRIPGQLDRTARGIVDARIMIERDVGRLENRFEIIEGGIKVDDLEITLYVKDKEGNKRPLNKREIEFLDNKFLALKNIGTMNMNYGQFNDLLSDIKTKWLGIMKGDKLETFDLGEYVRILLEVSMQLRGLDVGKRYMAQKHLKRLLSAIK